MKLVIYGAQGYALSVYEAIKSLYPRRKVSCFLVSRYGEYDAKELCGLPVREIFDFSAELSSDEKDYIEVLIATPADVQPAIEETLEIYGFHNYVRLDFNRFNSLVGMYHARLGHFLPLSALPVGCHKPFLRLYMAMSSKDKVLRGAVAIPDYVFPIHVGAAVSDVRLSEYTDDTGENISHKNGNYSELTGLYWIWKNRLCAEDIDDAAENRQYFGLCQYRRMFDFTDDDLMRLFDNEVDVVLPYPLPYEPNIEAHHKRYLKDGDWQALLKALYEVSPDYAEVFTGIMEQRYLYNYNVFLARKRVLREYCEWLFPILERVEELSEPKESERSDRYIGYMGEALETLYFMKNRNRLNVVHTGCMLRV